MPDKEKHDVDPEAQKALAELTDPNATTAETQDAAQDPDPGDTGVIKEGKTEG